MLIDLFSGLETGRAVTVEGVQSLLRTFEEVGDDGGAARASRVLLFIHGNAGHYDDMAAAAEQVVELATRAGEDRLVRSGAAVYTTAAVLGSTPVDQAIERCEQILQRVHGARRSEAIVLGALARLRAMNGEFEAARDLYRREQEYLGSLGPSRELASTSLDSGLVEILAGDLDAAERELSRDDHELEALHETYFRSSVSAQLARVLLLAGRRNEADRHATVAQALTDEGDVDGAVQWRLTRSHLLVGIDAVAAVQMADEAVALATRTEGLILQADALRSRADLLDDLGRPSEADASRNEAIRKYEIKGDRVSAAAARVRSGLESEVAEAR
jgi:tetratricopeptide (TPR) repeat protein